MLMVTLYIRLQHTLEKRAKLKYNSIGPVYKFSQLYTIPKFCHNEEKEHVKINCASMSKTKDLDELVNSMGLTKDLDNKDVQIVTCYYI